MGLAGFNRMRRLQAEVEAKAAEEIKIEVEIHSSTSCRRFSSSCK